MLRIGLALAALVPAACRAADPVPRVRIDAPYVLVLGTAQDAGLPQIGCTDAPCEAARRDPQKRRLVTSLLLVDPRSSRRWLFDCTPDLPEQVELARGHADPRRGANSRGAGGRPRLFEGIFLTHAHIGHYTGLAQLGAEAYATELTPVHGSRRMAEFLAQNGPWDLLVEQGRIEPRAMAADEALELAPDLAVTALSVPHRDEYTDTFAFLIRGPRRSLLYLPDIDKWERWERRIEDVLASVDHALLDGAFFADGEIPGRSMADIPHPSVAESLERFAPLPASERAKVWFTHLNHTNPAADPESAAAARVRASGMHVAREGDVFEL